MTIAKSIAVVRRFDDAAVAARWLCSPIPSDGKGNEFVNAILRLPGTQTQDTSSGVLHVPV